MKIKKDFWRNGKALWIQIIAFALAVILYSVCCYPIYTSSKARIMRQLYEDIHDMDLEELSEDDEETLGDYQKENKYDFQKLAQDAQGIQIISENYAVP